MGNLYDASNQEKSVANAEFIKQKNILHKKPESVHLRPFSDSGQFQVHS